MITHDPNPGPYNTPGDIMSGQAPDTYSTTGPVVATSSEATGNVNVADRTATAKSAHQMLIATGIMIIGVYLLVIVAGISQGAGRAVLALFGLAIVIWGLGNPATVLKYVQSQPLTPKASE
jgi:hypothetical protein